MYTLKVGTKGFGEELNRECQRMTGMQTLSTEVWQGMGAFSYLLLRCKMLIIIFQDAKC